MMSFSVDRRDPLLALRRGDKLSPARQMSMVLQLSFPAILAQLSTVVMQYIDAAMVGRLGAGGAAAIGRVSSRTWVFDGLVASVFAGFTVLVAQSIGAGDDKRARMLMREAFVLGLCFSIVTGAVGAGLSGFLPRWLGGEEVLRKDASAYFLVFVLALPMMQMDFIASAMLQASGNMRLPSLLNILMCFLDVVFNYFLIFPGGELWGIWLPGAGLGVFGAALGTALARVVTGSMMLVCLLFRSPKLHLRTGERLILLKDDFRLNFRLAIPVAVEGIVSAGAHIVYTGIVAPLGTVALAAHSFAITAESLCYMPGYGVAMASSTVIGQSIGAGRDDLTRRLGWLCVVIGMGLMGMMGLFMYLSAPWMMGLLSADAAVLALGAKMLRIVAIAEPFYAAAMVCIGVCRGAGDTLVPSLMAFGSMWLFRLPLAAYLAPRFGLRGVWLAMTAELVFRGCIFLARVAFHDWENTMKKPAG